MAQTNWSEMKCDILKRIFMFVDVIDLVKVSLVCKSWAKACTDPILWNKLDLSIVRSSSLVVPYRPYSWSDNKSSAKLNQILRSVFNLSKGNITCLIFQFFLYISDVHLRTVTERSPNLKQLVVPGWGQLSNIGIHNAMQYWSRLESMTIPSIISPYAIIEAIGIYCTKFAELKITCHFNIGLANSIIRHIPKLKILSLQCIVWSKEALVLLVNNLEDLEVLNICHSLILQQHEVSNNIALNRPQEIPAFLNLLRTKQVITCEGDTCIQCNASRDDFLREWSEF